MDIFIKISLVCLFISFADVVLQVVGHFEHTGNPLLLLVSMDGFRWDYLDKMKLAGRKTPNFDWMIKNGVHPKYSTDVFTSRTAPNHYSLATGLYEEHHGIVDNIFYDPVYKEIWKLSNETIVMDPKWYNGKPIWYVNQVHGNGYRSGVVLYPISRTPVNKVKPFRDAGPYNAGKMKFNTRIDKMIGWFTDDNYPINFGALYFQEPDYSGHSYGPSSDKMLTVIERMDKTLGYLLDKVKEHGMSENLNIIVTSDHGMTDISPKRIIELNKYVDPSLYTSLSHGAVWNVNPVPGKEEVIYDKLKDVAHMSVYRKKDIPAQYHYSSNRRIMPLLLVAEEGWQIVRNASDVGPLNGTHGYNNSLSSMHPIFIAMGPAFKRNYRRDPINLLDIFPLMCHILKVEAPPNDGKLERIHDLLSEDLNETATFVTFISVVIFAALVTGIFTIGAIRQTRYHKFRRKQIIRLNGISGEDSSLPMLGVNSDEEDEL